MLLCAYVGGHWREPELMAACLISFQGSLVPLTLYHFQYFLSLSTFCQRPKSYSALLHVFCLIPVDLILLGVSHY